MNIANSCLEQDKKLKTNTLEKQYESEEIDSDSSGNYSESDDINKFFKLQSNQKLSRISRNMSSKQEMHTYDQDTQD